MSSETLPFQVIFLSYTYILFYTYIYFLFYTYIYIFIKEIAGNNFLRIIAMCEKI